jgi:hypothetical protein
MSSSSTSYAKTVGGKLKLKGGISLSGYVAAAAAGSHPPPSHSRSRSLLDV